MSFKPDSHFFYDARIKSSLNVWLDYEYINIKSAKNNFLNND